MNMIDFIIPALLLALFAAAAFKKANVYDAFVRGAKNALPVLVSILPYMAAMLAALNIFRSSGVLAKLVSACEPVMTVFGIPPELTALIVLRPFSGGAAIALLDDVYKTCGVDSQAGYMASVMLGSTETIFYTVALYFGSIGVKKTRHAIITAIISGLAGIVAAVVVTNIMYK